MPSYKNPAPAQAARGAARGGFCNGIDALSQAYLDVHRNNPNSFGLNQIAGIISKYHGEEYLKQIMATATYMSYSAGHVDVNLRSNPQDFVSSVVAKLQESHHPQSVVLQDGENSHRVTVYGATPTASGWSLNIADSNHPEANVVSQVTLSVDSKTGNLTSTVGGSPKEHWNSGGLVTSPEQPSEKYIEMVDMAILGKPIEEIRAQMHADPVPVPEGAILAQKDPKTGGVLIRFDPAIFDDAVDETKLADLNRRLGAFLQTDAGGAAMFSLAPRVKNVTLVPFGSLSPTGTLGGLTRIEGFVLKPDGTAYLAGIKEPKEEPIPSAWLVVALQTEYAKGLAPYISLDPDPLTYSGPQNVRIGEIPQDLRSSSFIKTMLDADYLMKRINLGKEVPKVEGFSSWTERMSTTGGGGAVRMWFTPLALPAADSYIYRNRGALAVLFESQIQLMSEAQKTAGETGFGSGLKDTVAEQAANDFSEHMDQLSAMYPELHRLRGVFDVSKLAVCWRALNLKPNGTDQWLSAIPPKVSVPRTYPGIGPDLTKDGKYAVSGGAIAKARYKPGASVETDRLATMIASADQGEAVVELPDTLPLGETARAGFEAQNILATAQSELRSGLLQNALSHVGQVLALNPEDDDALTLQATVLGFQKRYPEAIAIIDKLLPRNPDLIGLRAVFNASSGDSAGALADADRTEAEFPESEAALATSIAARLIALDADGAARGLVKLRALSPAHPAISAMGLQVDLIRFLGPERARARMDMQTQIPIAISEDMLQSVNTPEGFAAYKDVLDKLESGTYAVPEKLYIAERVYLALASACVVKRPSDDDLKRIGAGVDKMVEEHPDWPSSYFARFCVLASIDAAPKLIVGALDKFAELEPNSDPILVDMQVIYREKRIAPTLAAVFAIDPTVRPDLRAMLAALAANLTRGQPGQAFLQFLGQNPNIDVGALNEAIDRGVMLGNAGEVAVALDHISAGVQSIPPSDAAFLPALCYCADALQLVKPDAPEFLRILAKGANLAAAGSPSRYLEPLAAKYRCQIWLRLSLEAARSQMDPNSAAIRAMGPAMAKMDRVMTPESSKDTLTSVEKTVDDVTAALGAYIRGLHASVAAYLKENRSKYGVEVADVIAFCIAEKQSTMNRDGTGELKQLAALHPGLDGTSSYAAFVGLNHALSSSFLISEPQPDIWRRILSGIKTRYDGLSVQELLSVLMGIGYKNTEILATYMAQVKAKTELGTG